MCFERRRVYFLNTLILNTLIKARVLYIVCGTLGVLGMYSVPSTGYCRC
jgi:hypothetical protein